MKLVKLERMISIKEQNWTKTILDTEQCCYWHASCHKEYSNRTNVEGILPKRGQAKADIKQKDVSFKSLNDQQNPEKSMRSSVAAFNWNLCIFCQNITILKLKVFVRL